MMNAPRLRAFLLAMLLAWPQAGRAQECAGTLTVGQCFSQLVDGDSKTEEPPAAARATQREVAQQTAKATTGPQLAGGDVSTAVRDFLPRLAAALVTPGLAEDGEALSLKLNQRLAGLSMQLGLEVRRPELYPALLQSIPEAVREDAQSRLEKRLEDYQDFTVGVAFNAEDLHFGRSYRPHLRELSEVVGELAPPLSSGDAAAVDALTELFADISSKWFAPGKAGTPGCNSAGSPTNWRLDCFPAEVQAAVTETLRSGADALAEQRVRRRAALNAVQFNLLPQLLNNQPQLNGTVSYRYRDDLAGPDEITGTFRYEKGFRNLNWLRATCGGAIDAACFRNTLAAPRLPDQLARGQRLWGQVDFSYQTEYDIVIPRDSVNLDQDRAMQLRGSLGYGQYFGRLSEGTRRPRVDLDLSYAYQVEGSVRNDRAVAKVAYTHPVSDQFAAVLGLAWANKPEYLGDDARRFGAALGVTYKLVKNDP